MAYKTGVTRTASWEFAFAGTNTLVVQNLAIGPPPPLPAYGVASGNMSVSASGGFLISIAPYFEAIPGGGEAVGDPYDVRYGVTVTVSDGLDTDTSNVYDVYTIAGNAVTTISYDIELTGTFSFDVEEWVEFLPIGSGYYNSIPDNPPHTRARWFLKTRPGGDISASCGGASVSHDDITGGDGTDFTVNLLAGGTAENGVSGAWSVTMTDAPISYSVPVPATASNSISGQGSSAATAGGAGISTEATAEAAADEDHPTSATVSGSSILVGDRDYDMSGVVRAMETAYPDDVTMVLGGHVGTDPVIASGGTWSASGTQKSYLCVVNCQGEEDSKSADEHAPISASLLSDDLEANGDEPKLTRSLWRGWQTSGITISQASSFALIDNEDAPSEWNEETTVASGVATLSPSAASLVFTPKVSGLSYRYLRFDVKSTGGADVPLSVSIPPNDITDDDRHDVSGGGSVAYEDPYSGDEETTKEWDFTSGDDGAWKTITIDLCAPHNLSSTTDAQDSRFPIPSRMPLYYGISRLASLDFAGIPSGMDAATVEVRNVEFVLLDPASPRFDFLPTFHPNQYRVIDDAIVMKTEWHEQTAKWRADEILDSGTTTEFFLRRFLAGRADGKASVEEQDFGYTKTLTSGGVLTYSFGGPSVSGLVDAINAEDMVTLSPPGPGDVPPRVTGTYLRYPGITATVSTPANDSSDEVTDGYLNRDLPATFVFGAGAMFNSTDGWRYGFDIDPATESIPMQPLYDELEWYAGCVDPFGHSTGSPDGMVAVGAAILRGGGHALVWGAIPGDPPAPLAGRTVRVEEGDPATNRGSGNSESGDGYAQTGEPWLQAVSTEELVDGGDDPDYWESTTPSGTMYCQDDPSDLAIGITPWNRRRVRGAFRVVVTVFTLLRWLSMDASATGRLVQAGVDAETGEIILRYPVGFGVGMWAETPTGITGERPCVRYARRRSSGELILLYEDAGAIKRQGTTSEGGSLTVATTITSAGEFPTMAILPTGAEAFAWWVTGGAIKFKVLDAFGGVMVAELTAVASGVAEDALGLVCRDDGSFVLAYHNTGGAIVTVVSTNGGTTWA